MHKKVLFFIIILIFPIVIKANNFGIIDGISVRLRSKPSTESKIIAKLNNKEKIKILSEEKKLVLIGKYYGKWIKVRRSSDQSGYILNCFLKSPKTDTELLTHHRKLLQNL